MGSPTPYVTGIHVSSHNFILQEGFVVCCICSCDVIIIVDVISFTVNHYVISNASYVLMFISDVITALHMISLFVVLDILHLSLYFINLVELIFTRKFLGSRPLYFEGSSVLLFLCQRYNQIPLNNCHIPTVLP